MKKMTMLQVRLAADGGECVTWLPFDKRIKKGTKLTLHKVDDRLFEVIDVYGTADRDQIRQDWNNNI